MTMQCYPAGPAWFVISTAPGADRIVRDREGTWGSTLVDEVAELGFDVYQPRERAIKTRRRQRVEVVAPLFVGYMFARFDEHLDDWQRILDVRGVDDVLSNCDRPSRIPTAWIEALRKAEGLGAFDRRKGAPSPFDIGQVVRITEGPLAGLQAVVDRFITKVSSASPGRKVKVLMTFLGGLTATEIDLVALEKV